MKLVETTLGLEIHPTVDDIWAGVRYKRVFTRDFKWIITNP